MVKVPSICDATALCPGLLRLILSRPLAALRTRDDLTWYR